MNSLNWIYRACCIGVFSAVPLVASGGSIQGARGAHCSAFLPADAETVDSVHLCHSDHSGKNALYACQNFATHHAHYRVFFKGGPHPKAIASVTENGDIDKMLWSEEMPANRPVCDFPSPIHIPAAAKFMGAGVCLDESDASIPCTLFRYKASQLKTISDYVVFYKVDGVGPEYASTIASGVNRNAMPAELAYKMGLSLLKTDCHPQRGLQYIKHAYQLFPNSTLYRTAYQHYTQQVSKGTPLQPTCSRTE